MRSELDHLVVACTELDQGAAWCERTLGVASQAGGKHAAMGTHNRLLKLGARVYLELIAIDPDAPAPARPRWFDLDRPDIRRRVSESPFLLTWVARCDDIHTAAARVPALGEVTPFTRNEYAWRFTLRDDGALQFGGDLPSVIQWDSDAHPADALEDRGCELLSLELSHPAAPSVVPMFRELKITGVVEVKTGIAGLRARVRTGKGVVEF
jgi:hypothetical protein